jgi:predicted DCC family thiol-disulfide oxidoreductase YuxK
MPATVIYDADCGLCNRVRELTEALDWLGTMRWIPWQSSEASRFGIPAGELRDAVFLVTPGGASSGWGAVKRIALRVPLTWVAAAVLVRKSPWAALGLAFLLSPLAEPAGRAAYGWVAGNRYRFPGSTCPAPVWDNRNK